jgi:ATP-dependent Clp protease ATP-binding subunit ClpA
MVMSDLSGPVPTPRYLSIVGSSFDVARAMGHSYVGVEHLFLAMIRDRHAIPTQVLAGMMDLNAVESALLDLMNSDGYRTSTPNVGYPEGPSAT